LATLATALILGGCGASDFDTSGWFSKPLDLFGRKGDYTFSLASSKQDPITANDLIDANGACPTAAALRPEAKDAAGNPAASTLAAPDEVARLRGGISAEMSECEVVARVGRPSAVNLGNNQNGDRTAIMTFTGGPRPGVYRFVGGRLTEIYRVAEPAPGPEQKKFAGAKKPARTKKQGDDAT
jgi:hypothetical protein